MKTEADILKDQIDILLGFPYVSAWTGELAKLTQKSYVEYAHILEKTNELRQKLKKIEKQTNNID